MERNESGKTEKSFQVNNLEHELTICIEANETVTERRP